MTFLFAIFALALVSNCSGVAYDPATFPSALENALVEGGCSDCLVPTDCPESKTSFNAGEIRCDNAGKVTFLRIDPSGANGTSMYLTNLTSFDSTSFLVGDMEYLDFTLGRFPQLAFADLSAITSLIDISVYENPMLTAANISQLESIRYSWASSYNGWTSLSMPRLASVESFHMIHNHQMVSVDLPLLTTTEFFSLGSNSGLRSLNIPSLSSVETIFFISGNPLLSGVLRVAPGVAATAPAPDIPCIIRDSCFVSYGNAVASTGALCQPGGNVEPVNATAACAICPEPANVGTCSTTNTLGLNVFNENGDDMICFKFDQDPSTLTGGSLCKVTVSSSIGSINARTATFSSCELTFDGSGNVLSMDLANSVDSILLTPLNDAPCGHTLDIDLDGVMGTRKRQAASGLSVTSSVVPLTTAAASASGDPHLVGPHNERFDFDGEPNGIYALFTTPQFVVNMQLHPDGPKTRFIHEVGVVFRNVSMFFNTQMFDAKQKSMMLNKKLAQFEDGRAIVTPFNIELELCDGHRVQISQRFTEWKADGAIKAQRFYHLDVNIQVPGCHDSFGGALGQTYQCKYNHEKFVFSHDQEASFALEGLFETSGSFDSNSPCHDQRVYVGQEPMSGGSNSMDRNN